MVVHSLGTEVTATAMARHLMTNSQVSGRRLRRRRREGWFAQARSLLRLWRQRTRQRTELARLSELDLHDFGMSEADARYEAAKWFWHG